ncbi:MAG TPA: hypothetical protein H9850_01960 [Candidatus Anaerobiospirillum pullistercoris]|uniref:Uncharacterized protein n=1 Tax=Candidatus Anaerobiospirillum pullistercoris TaxID=2838452 RepID=A0A9D1WBQ8_9GAMM|nr:hypothetical protein [Candidatus Anaerobiospirillum pullistercoris]
MQAQAHLAERNHALRRSQHSWQSALLCCSALMLTACSASSVNLGVYLSPEVAQTYGEVPSLEVDVAGVTAKQKQTLEQISVEQYFAPNSALRRSIQPVTLYFSPLQQRPYSIEKSFAAWDLWEQRGAEYVMVLCNLPLLADSAPQGAAGTGASGAASAAGASGSDSRMLFIEMHDGFIKDSSSHVVEITSTGVIKVADEPDAADQGLSTENTSGESLGKSVAQQANEQAAAAAAASAAATASATNAATLSIKAEAEVLVQHNVAGAKPALGDGVMGAEGLEIIPPVPTGSMGKGQFEPIVLE